MPPQQSLSSEEFRLKAKEIMSLWKKRDALSESMFKGKFNYDRFSKNLKKIDKILKRISDLKDEIIRLGDYTEVSDLFSFEEYRRRAKEQIGIWEQRLGILKLEGDSKKNVDKVNGHIKEFGFLQHDGIFPGLFTLQMVEKAYTWRRVSLKDKDFVSESSLKELKFIAMDVIEEMRAHLKMRKLKEEEEEVEKKNSHKQIDIEPEEGRDELIKKKLKPSL